MVVGKKWQVIYSHLSEPEILNFHIGPIFKISVPKFDFKKGDDLPSPDNQYFSPLFLNNVQGMLNSQESCLKPQRQACKSLQDRLILHHQKRILKSPCSLHCLHKARATELLSILDLTQLKAWDLLYILKESYSKQSLENPMRRLSPMIQMVLTSKKKEKPLPMFAVVLHFNQPKYCL